MCCKNQKKETKIKLDIGKRFRIANETYIVAQVDTNVFKLIGLTCGNRWSDNGETLEDLNDQLQKAKEEGLY